jgi:hypothetical protein
MHHLATPVHTLILTHGVRTERCADEWTWIWQTPLQRRGGLL